MSKHFLAFLFGATVMGFVVHGLFIGAVYGYLALAIAALGVVLALDASFFALQAAFYVRAEAENHSANSANHANQANHADQSS